MMAAKGLVHVAGVDVNPVSVFRYVLVCVCTTAGTSTSKYVACKYDGQSLRSRDMTVSAWGPEGSLTRGRRPSMFIVLPWVLGEANHSVPTEKLKAKCPDYEITWAGEGY